MTQEQPEPRPAPLQSIRDRQMRVGANLAGTAYNRLLVMLQDADAKLSVDQLAHLIEAGTRIEGRAYAELPLEFDPDADLERILQAGDFERFLPPGDPDSGE